MLHDKNIRAWFDLEPVLAGRDVGLVDGKWVFFREDKRKYVGTLAWEGVNGFRRLAFGGWKPSGGMQTAAECFTPYQVEGGKFNLRQENPDYWPIIVEDAKIHLEFNAEYAYCLFDHCQFKGDPAWACWRNNVQGFGSYFDSIPDSVAHVKNAIKHLGSMPHVMFVIINEGKVIGSMAQVEKWYKAVYQALRDGGIAPERIDVGALLNGGEWNGSEWVRERTLQDWTKSWAKEIFGESPGKKVWLPAHNITDDPTKQFPFGAHWRMAEDYWPKLPHRLSNDGCKDKDSPASLILWREMCRATMAGKSDRVIFELLSDADLQGKALAARYMADGIGTSRLVNWHRKAYVPETQPVEPEQPVTPDPVKPRGDKWREIIAIVSLSIIAALVALAIFA
jgi:hypothetical protein